MIKYAKHILIQEFTWNSLTHSLSPLHYMAVKFGELLEIKKELTMKRTLNSLVKPVMDNCRKYYINWFKDKLASLKNSEESKLQIFTLPKWQYQYECFLDHTPFGKYI